MKIRETNKYELFKTIEGNRDVVKQHVKKLVESIKGGDLTNFLPIVVNEKMEVVDGQHRLEALKALGRPVPYIIIEGSDLTTVQKLNSTSKSWSLDDYIQSYVKRGNENYAVLDEFKSRHDLPLGICINLLMGNGKENHCVGETIRSGDFIVKSRNAAEAVATYITEIRKYIDKKLSLDREFLRACIKVINGDVDRRQLLHKMRLFGHTLTRQTSTTDYLREMERIYNFRNQGERIRLF